ncbi:MAG: serine/threonine protein kinase [Acidobacteria bacterium]|nr:serine/threonine protein kinase [Acidobacteriota bacterium]
MDDRWERLMSVFEKATDLSTVERSEFLSQVLLEDATIYDELLGLVEAEKNAHGFLEKPLELDLSAPLIGSKVGPYTITAELGRGGMGAVFQADREDDFKQHCALKISNRVILTADLERRFKKERQILASLEHPHIVRLLDGGVTPDKIPYFVMELVDGEPITTYCKRHSLSIKERLMLFQQICSAVSYAHQLLIVHRDLKPSNILVTKDGNVKLLDFGIAKILDDEDRAQTQTLNAPITPEYASPEQILDKPISTSADIYSLGLILYEILTELPPVEIYGVSRTDISRGIREVDPQRPSVKVGDRALKGDLDNIVLNCLEKAPELRYASVEQLSADIERYLTGYPIVAHKRSAAYRARKFVSRNRFAVAFGAVAAILLMMATSFAIWQAVEARREQARAQANFAQVRKFATSLVIDYNDDLTKLPGSLKLRERLISDAVTSLDAISATESSDPELLKEVGLAYRKIGTLQAMLWTENLGKLDEALVNENKGVQLLGKAISLKPNDPTLLDAFAATLADFGRLMGRKGGGSSIFHSYAREIIQLALAIDPDNFERKLDLFRVRTYELDALVDHSLSTEQREATSLTRYHELFDEVEKAEKQHPDDLRLQRILLNIANRICLRNRWIGTRIYQSQHDQVRAQPYFAESVEFAFAQQRHSQAFINSDPNSISNLRLQASVATNLALALPFLGRFTEAEDYQRTAAEIMAKARDNEPNNVENLLDVLSIFKNKIDIQILRKNGDGVYKLASEGIAVLDTYDKRTGGTTNFESMQWRGYFLKQQLTSLQVTNSDSPEILRIEKKLREMESKFEAANADFDDWSGITLG